MFFHYHHYLIHVAYHQLITPSKRSLNILFFGGMGGRQIHVTFSESELGRDQQLDKITLLLYRAGSNSQLKYLENLILFSTKY